MRRTTIAWLALLALLAGTAWGADDDEAAKAAEKRAKDAIKRHRDGLRSRNESKRCNTLLELSRTEHPLVVDEMAKVLRKDRSVEVRQACAMALGMMKGVADEAGAALRAELVERNEDFPKLLIAIGDSIGKLGYKGAHDGLLWMLDHQDQWVVVSAIRAIALVGDMKALPKLYDMAEYQGQTFSWSTGEVVVDTGASGDVDQRAAEAAWKAKYGHVRPKKAGPTVVKLYMRHLRETVEKLTGQKFKDLAEFKAWLEEHAEEVGLKPAR
jgi:HEAT repeat protein